jgi:hypothetical protein
VVPLRTSPLRGLFGVAAKGVNPKHGNNDLSKSSILKNSSLLGIAIIFHNIGTKLHLGRLER